MINSAFSKDIDNHLLINQLGKILNQKHNDSIKDLFLRKKSFEKFNKQYQDFRKNHTNVKWTIETISNHPAKIFLDIRITAKREIADQIYNLKSKQTVKIETFKNKIKRYQVIEEESVLNSPNSPLVIKIISPDKVLTGEKYEMSLIIEKPLDDSLMASGMIVLENTKKINITNDKFAIKPNKSGGLFKYIQAPLDPGYQTISAIIMHPEGIYSITKKIRVGL